MKNNKGFYLYCIRGKADSKFSTKGIDGEGEVFTFPYQDLEAVVSEVSLEEFGSEEIKQKAQEELNWIKEKAQLHEVVIEEAMQNNGGTLPVIPMSFGTIFKSIEKIRQTLEEHYTKFNTVLAGLRGKQEWGVKVYLINLKILEEEVKNRNGALKAKEKEIAAMPKGMGYFFKKQMAELISSEVAKEIENNVDNFFLALNKQAVAGIKGKILDKEITGKSESMVLNGIYLIRERKTEDFKNEIGRLSRETGPRGFRFEYSGPWPPYNFVKV